MGAVRKPAVAGLFYPDDEVELAKLVRSYLREGHGADAPPRAIIAPHAGYIYSGPIAGSAFKAWRDMRHRVNCVAILGPSHRVAFEGVAASSADIFATPLGVMPVDTSARDELLSLPFVNIFDNAHRFEHSIETHLPFIQETIGEVPIVPLVVGDASVEEIAQVCETLLRREGMLISVSSDLSHYLPYDLARRVDAETSRAIEENRPRIIGPERACGWLPIQGLLAVAARHGWTARALDVRNSGDTAGDRDRVVGYGAYALG